MGEREKFKRLVRKFNLKLTFSLKITFNASGSVVWVKVWSGVWVKVWNMVY
jgi:hypothetical protein